MFDNANEFDADTFTNGRFAADRGVSAKFYTKAVQDQGASDEAGRPIFVDQVFVEIIAAGNANNIVSRRATREDKQRFGRQFQAFEAGRGEELLGTPLTEVSWITRSQVEELAYFKVRTLESLAHVDDNFCSRAPGMQDLRRKALAALEASDKAAPLTQLTAENEALKNELETLKNQVKELTSTLKTKKD